MSILAVYSTIAASEYDLKKDDMHTHAIVHRYHFQPSYYDLKSIIRKSVCIKKGIPPKESIFTPVIVAVTVSVIFWF